MNTNARKNRTQTPLLLSLTLSLVATSFAFAKGGSSGSGGNDLIPAGALDAWFTGDREIKYCVELAPKFGIDQTQANAEIEFAFATWRTYMNEKGVNDRFPARAPVATIANRSKLVAKCDGTQDLEFYLGVYNPKVSAERKKYFNADAFAKRESYDVANGWGKGFIWIAAAGTLTRDGELPNQYPDWKIYPELFKALVMHELGHVYGNGHIENTIMSADFGRHNGIWLSAQVDQGYELFNERATSVYKGEVGATEIFENFVGTPPRGTPTAEVAFTRGKGFTLTMMDDRGSHPIPLLKTFERFDHASSEQVFGVTAPGGEARENNRFGGTLMIVQAKTGKLGVVTVYIAHNMEVNAFLNATTAYYLDKNGKMVRIFR